ncbi:MAG: ATP-binding cassette domain-containing protein [Bifidobacteriaceae bacterium]|nr:ATP-binding cassette domain-containing protein [Bifidobacteriaceae bacterium]
MNPGEDLIVLADAARTYPGPPPVEALRPTTLAIRKGDFVAVVGPSGSGKSTLLNVVGLLDTPTSGRRVVDGLDTARLSARERAGLRGSRIGFVFQAFHLIEHRTVVENVALAGMYRGRPKAERLAAARVAVDRVGLSHRADFLPSRLSGGERQRVAIARAVAADPKVLLCDEPTGNLDSRRAAEIIGLFEGLSRDGLCLVLVTHDEQLAARADRRLRMRDGAVTASTSRSRRQESREDAAFAPGAADGVDCPRPRIRLVDGLAESVASVAARPGRSLLTMTGTVLGCAALTAIIGLTTTAAGQITSRFNQLQATTVTLADTATEESGVPGYSFPQRVGAKLRELNGVVDGGVYAEAFHQGWLPQISTRPEIDGGPGVGVQLRVAGAEPGTLVAAGAKLASGNGMDEFHVDSAQPVAVLGPAAAARLGIASVAIRPTVFIGDNAYAVVGVLSDTGALPDLATAVILPITTMLAHYGPPAAGQPAHALVRTDLGAAALAARQAPYKLRPENPGALTAFRAPDWSAITDDVDASVSGLLLALAGVAVVIGCVAIANTTLVAVMERTGEIGLRQALGASPSQILGQFLAESVLLGGIGGLIGSALGTATVLIGSVLQSWSPVMDPRLGLASPAIGVAAGALAGIYPSWRASRISPVAALQHS